MNNIIILKRINSLWDFATPFQRFNLALLPLLGFQMQKKIETWQRQDIPCPFHLMVKVQKDAKSKFMHDLFPQKKVAKSKFMIYPIQWADMMFDDGCVPSLV